MKKIIALALCLMMAAALVPASAEGTLKTGLAAVVAMEPTDATENKDGQVRNEVTIAAVAIDEQGVIVDCKIDAYRSDIKFDAKGAFTQPLDTAFKSKMAMGAEYGMGAVAPKGEWDAQAAGFAAYCIGKTADQIRGIAVEGGKPAASEVDILATTTITIGDFVGAVVKAADKAEDRGAKAGDTLYLTSVANMSSSKAATENKDGTAQFDCTYAAITKAGETITSIVIDAVQCKASISGEGKVTSDTTAEVPSKLEKGDAYGMGSVAPKGEWYQQIAGFNAYVTGKTAEEVTGIAVGEDGKPTDADLTATTTINIAEFLELIALTK
jgi:hypothetical protein